MKEWPVHASQERQIISGRIDLLLDDGDELAIVDHKSFPGSIELNIERLKAFVGQVSLYAQAIQSATGRTCSAYWVHQAIAGSVTRIELP